MKIYKLDQDIRQKIDLCTRDQLLHIHHDLNEWKWNDLLGDKPDDFDILPCRNYKWIHKFFKRKNQYDITHPIMMYISGMFSKKELLYYHNVECNGMTEEEFDKFWRKYELEKFCEENNIIMFV